MPNTANLRNVSFGTVLVLTALLSGCQGILDSLKGSDGNGGGGGGGDDTTITNFTAHYAFEETSGAAILNSAADYYHGDLLNVSRVTGIVGNALQFGGTAKATISPQRMTEFTGDRLSFRAWVYLDSSPSGLTCQLLGGGTTGTSPFMVQLNDGKIELLIGLAPTGYQSVVLGGTAISTGVWTQVAVTYDGSTAKAFVNGGEDGSHSVSVSIPLNLNPYWMGADENGTNQLPGKLDEVYLENATWTGNQVSQFYTNDLP